MSEIDQTIFNRAYAEELREKLVTGQSLESYFKHDIVVPDEGKLQSTLLVSDQIPALNPDVIADVDNAIILYEFLSNLDKTQASDKRLWIYLSHVTFRDYTMARWNLSADIEQLKLNVDLQRKAMNVIVDRWFLTGNARSLRRHSISRLWWAAYLTVAPWETDSEYFAGLEDSDRFLYTKVLFTSQDIVQQILERRLGWSDRMLIAILEYFRQHSEVAHNRDSVRTLMKELNLVLGYRKLSVLSFEQLVSVIAETAVSVGIQ